MNLSGSQDRRNMGNFVRPSPRTNENFPAIDGGNGNDSSNVYIAPSCSFQPPPIALADPSKNPNMHYFPSHMHGQKGGNPWLFMNAHTKTEVQGSSHQNIPNIPNVPNLPSIPSHSNSSSHSTHGRHGCMHGQQLPMHQGMPYFGPGMGGPPVFPFSHMKGGPVMPWVQPLPVPSGHPYFLPGMNFTPTRGALVRPLMPNIPTLPPLPIFDCKTSSTVTSVESGTDCADMEASMSFPDPNDPALRPFKCEYCHRRYKRERGLQRHIKVHDVNTPGCPHCGKKFARKTYLEDHIRTHTGEKPFQCVHCLKRFPAKRNLNQHLLIHSPVKKHVCTVCHKRFRLRRHLRHHVANIHSD